MPGPQAAPAFLEHNLAILHIWATKTLPILLQAPKSGKRDERWTWIKVMKKRSRRLPLDCIFENENSTQRASLSTIVKQAPCYRNSAGVWVPLSRLLRSTFLDGTVPIKVKGRLPSPAPVPEPAPILAPPCTTPPSSSCRFLTSLLSLGSRTPDEEPARPLDTNQAALTDTIKTTHQGISQQTRIRELLAEYATRDRTSEATNSAFFADLGEICNTSGQRIQYCPPPHLPDAVLCLRPKLHRNRNTFTGLLRQKTTGEADKAPPTCSNDEFQRARQLAREYVRNTRAQCRPGTTLRYVPWPPPRSLFAT